MRIHKLAVVGLVALVVGAVAAGGCGKGPTDLKITGTPTGEVTGKMHVTVVFSRPIITADKIGPAVAPPMKLEPDLPGDIVWQDDKTLIITPKSDLPISTKYTVTIPSGTKALDGNKLADDFSFSFFTQQLTASFDVLGNATHADKDQNVRLAFNQNVALDQVLAHCKYAAAGADVQFKNGKESPSGPARSYTLAPATELKLDTAYVLTCDTDLRGMIGNMGIEKPTDTKLHTYGPLHFVKLDPSGKDITPDESTRVALQFTNPLKEPYQIAITPAVQGFPENCHALDGDEPGLSCAVALEPQTNYTLTIDAKQVDAFDQALGKSETFTFHTTDAKPSLSMETGYFIAELKRPVLPIWARNVTSLDVTAVPITQENFSQLRPLLSWWDSKAADLSKTKLAPITKKIAVAGAKNKWSQHPLGAADLFAGGVTGPGMFYLELSSSEVDDDEFKDGGKKKILVNFTDIGVVTKLSGARGLVWATKLSTGKALPGATVTVRDGDGKVKFTGTTGADGSVLLPGTAALIGPPKTKKKAATAPTNGDLDPNGEHYSQERGGATNGGGEDDGNGNAGDPNDLSNFRVYVALKDDWTMVSPTRSNGLSSWNFNVQTDSDASTTRLRGFMHTDRGLYRPGEKVHVKGLARTSHLSDPLDVPGEGKKVAVTVTGPTGKTFASPNAKLSAFGGFWFDLDLPGDARLGDYSISATLESGTFNQTFTVEEYRPATYEVTGKAKEQRLVREGTLHAQVSANYFYGSPVRSGDVQVTVHARRRYVEFAGFDGYDFSDRRSFDGYYSESDASQQLVTENHATLDEKGNGNVSVDITPNDIAHDSDLLFSTNVTAPSNEVESHSFTVPYYAAKTYFGVKSPGYFFDVNSEAKVQIVAVDVDGKPAKAPAKVTVERRDWNCVWEDWGYRGNYNCKEVPKKILEKTINVDGAHPAEVTFKPEGGGDYWVVVEGTNDKQQVSPAAFESYAYGDGGGNWRSDDTMSLDIVADKKEYKAGDTATLLLKTDLAQATGLVTIERDGVIEKHTVEINAKVKHLKIPITAAYAPNVYVSIALVQGRMGEGTRGKPRLRMGVIDLPVHPEDNKLTVEVSTDKPDYRPGEQVTATIKVSDAAGAPASAEVSIAAADEGVLALLGFKTPDPIPTFFASWGLGVQTATQLEYLRDIPGANQDRPALGGDAVGTVRSHFASTAVWTPNAVTDATGTATITFTAPDNLTAFRVMALAADKGHKFGSADKRFTVSKPLQLLSSLPRFADIGDVLQGGVVVHNDTGRAGTATVKLVLNDRLTTTEPLERTVDLPKDSRVPVLWPLTGALEGSAVMQFSVAMDADNDAVQLTIPVLQPAKQRVAEVGNGAVKAETVIKVPIPKDAGGDVEVSVSVDPYGLAGIDKGLKELVHYPYGCLEQTTSQVIPMLAARKLAEELQIDGLTGPALDGYVRAGVTKIGLHQGPYGGFSLWPGGDPDPYYTAYALWGLWHAKGAGFTVDPDRVDDGLNYLRNDGVTPDASRPHYSEHGNRGSQAFSLYVRALWGDPAAAAAATKLNDDVANLPIYGKAFLARALAKTLPKGAKDPAVTSIVTQLEALVTTATKADKLLTEPMQRELWSYMSSDVRTTAIVLDALVELDPKSDVIAPLVRVVMKNRNASGYEGDTQSDMYAIVALSNYAKTASSKPGSVAVKFMGSIMLQSALNVMKVESHGVLVHPTNGKLPDSTTVTISPTDGAEVFYDVSVRYRQRQSELKAEANGLILALEYLDEAGKPKTSFRVGDVVRVRATTTVQEDADHMMVAVQLPAGFEAINTRFVTSEQNVPQSTDWGAYEEMHDSSVNYATEYSSGGVYTHEFLMRAMTAGKFVRPPTVAELMYQPKTTARTAADTIEIRAK